MKSLRRHWLFIGDIIVLSFSFLIVVFIKGSFVLKVSLVQELLWPFILATVICLIVSYAFDLYDFRYIRPVSSNLWRIAAVLSVSPVVSVIFFYTFNIFDVAPKATLIIYFISFGVLFILWRRAFYKIFSRSFKNRTVVWGTSQS